MKIKKLILNIFSVFLWIGVWFLISYLVKSDLLMPSPVETFNALIELLKTDEFYLSVLMSFLRIFTGLICGVIIGSLAGFLTVFSRLSEIIFEPVFQIIKTTPVASFIVLAIVWLKSKNIPAFISMLIVIPFMWSNVKIGIATTDKKLLQMADCFNVGFVSEFKNIYIPNIKPYFISAVSTSMGLAWKAGIAAEVICYPENSIGRGIYNSKIYMLTPELFAWTAVVIILSVILEKVILKLIGRLSDDKA